MVLTHWHLQQHNLKLILSAVNNSTQNVRIVLIYSKYCMRNDTQFPTESGKISLKLKDKSKGTRAIASSKQPAQRNMNQEGTENSHYLHYKTIFSIRYKVA